MAWMFAQLFIGLWLRFMMNNLRDLKLIMRVKTFIRYSGWPLIIAAAANCWIGLQLMFDDTQKLPNYLFTSYVIAFGALALGLELRRLRGDKSLTARKQVLVNQKKGTVAPGELGKVQSMTKLNLAAGKNMDRIAVWSRKDYNTRLESGPALLDVDGFVLDVSRFSTQHPAGSKVIEQWVGLDATMAFLGHHAFTDMIHPHSDEARAFLKTLVKARLDLAPHDGLEENHQAQSRVALLCQMRHKYVGVAVEAVRELNRAANKIIEITLALDPPAIAKLLGRTAQFSVDPREAQCDKNKPAFKWGCHVRLLECPFGHTVANRAYTPIDCDLAESHKSMKIVVKCYPNGEMSAALRKLTPGMRVRVHGPFDGDDCGGLFRNLVWFCGGTGLTPALACLNAHRQAMPAGGFRAWILFSNHTAEDFFYVSELEETVKAMGGALKITYVITSLQTSKGGIEGLGNKPFVSGKVSDDLIRLMNIPPPHAPQGELELDTLPYLGVFTSGPPGFCKNAIEVSALLGYTCLGAGSGSKNL
jgi:ferredoxin-NADP reductase/cytochrome b involved in lipid metabolism